MKWSDRGNEITVAGDRHVLSRICPDKRVSHDTLRVPPSGPRTEAEYRESWLKLKGEDNLNILYKTTPFLGLRTSRESF